MKFQRSINGIIDTILLIPFILCVLRCVVAIAFWMMGVVAHLNADSIGAGILISLGIWALGIGVVPPDFDYFIRDDGDFVIFEMSADDHRAIKKSCKISKSRHEIMLDDGSSRILIAYNKEVEEYLQEIINC